MKLQVGQRVKASQAASGWNTASTRGGDRVSLFGQHGTVVDVSDSLAMVELPVSNGDRRYPAKVLAIFDRLGDPRIELLDKEILLDLNTAVEAGAQRLAELIPSLAEDLTPEGLRKIASVVLEGAAGVPR